MTAPMDAAQIAALDAKLASQIGDDVQRIYDHEALFKESRAALQAQAAELERLRAERDAFKMLQFAAETFCNRVDIGEIRSKRTYAAFKDALAKIGGAA